MHEQVGAEKVKVLIGFTVSVIATLLRSLPESLKIHGQNRFKIVVWIFLSCFYYDIEKSIPK